MLGGRGRQPGQLYKPRAVAITASGILVCIDRTGRIQTYETESGELHSRWTLPRYDDGTPTGISVDPTDDTIWVADTHNQRILQYDTEGNLLFKFGEHGIEPGKFVFPTDVCPTPDGSHLWVTEYGIRNRLMLFRRDGTFVQEWGGAAYQEGELQRPMAVISDNADRIFVADAGHHRINCYASDGELLYRFGVAGKEPGQILYPYDLALAADGTLYVCEYGNSRISHFTPEGQFLGCWGLAGQEPGELFCPWGIATSPRGELVVADTNNHRLQFLNEPERYFNREPGTPK